MRNKVSNRLKNKISATEHFDVESVSNEEMLK